MSNYFTLEEVAKEQFIRVPKVFIEEDSKYFSMSAMTKLLYGVLLDRNTLSIKNGWVDEDKRVFFLFKQESLCRVLGTKDPKTVRKYLNELEKYGLLERKKQGVNLSDKLYLKRVEIAEDQAYKTIGKNSLPDGEKFPNGQGKIPYQDGEKFPTNKNESNKNESNKNENSSATEKVEKEFVDTVIKKWNDIGLNVVRNIKGKRLDSLHARIKEYSKDDVLTVIENVKYSDFLKGNNNRNWTADIDWILKPNNFIKVLEGNYNKGKGIEKKGNSSSLNAISNYNFDINSLIEKMQIEV